MFYHTCEYCGANLDPGEKCDCIEVVQRKIHKQNKDLVEGEIKNGSYNSKTADNEPVIGY